MTCIVGLVDGERVWMGGDSAGVRWYDLTIRADQKVFLNGEFLMGFTDSFRMGQLLRYAFQPPPLKECQDLYDYMVVDFVGALRQCLKEGGYAKRENEVERGGTFLVGFRGRLFTVESDYQVGEPARAYSAVGCGESYALGALWASSGVAKTRVRKALQCAADMSAGVAPPFEILSTP